MEKEAYLIDFLPQRVCKKSRSDYYFQLEALYHQKEKHEALIAEFAQIIVKALCYYKALVILNQSQEWTEFYEPKAIGLEKKIMEMGGRYNETMCILFGEDHALLKFEDDDLYMALFNPSEEMAEIFGQLARSAGLFWRKSKID